MAPADAVEHHPKSYADIQSTVHYTVYRPSTTLSLARTSLTTQPCNGLDEMTSATYGVEGAAGGSITLQESQRGGCVDGTDGIAKYTTFKVRGATATVRGECTEGTSCTSSTAAGVRHYAYTSVRLPAAAGFSSTLVGVYTTGIDLPKIKRFISGLVPAAV
jgi:hypothetical protein